MAKYQESNDANGLHTFVCLGLLGYNFFSQGSQCTQNSCGVQQLYQLNCWIAGEENTGDNQVNIGLWGPQRSRSGQKTLGIYCTGCLDKLDGHCKLLLTAWEKAEME